MENVVHFSVYEDRRNGRTKHKSILLAIRLDLLILLHGKSYPLVSQQLFTKAVVVNHLNKLCVKPIAESCYDFLAGNLSLCQTSHAITYEGEHDLSIWSIRYLDRQRILICLFLYSYVCIVYCAKPHIHSSQYLCLNFRCGYSI